jgi:PAS domain S-box-containing protein
MDGRETAQSDEAEQQVAILQKVLDAVYEGVIVTDIDGKIIFFNKALESMEGLKSSEVVGRYLPEVYRVSPGKTGHSSVVKSGKPYQEQSITYFTAKGDEINLIASYYPVEHQGKIIGAFTVCRDFTRIKDLITNCPAFVKRKSALTSLATYKTPLTDQKNKPFIFNTLEHLLYKAIPLLSLSSNI